MKRSSFMAPLSTGATPTGGAHGQAWVARQPIKLAALFPQRVPAAPLRRPPPGRNDALGRSRSLERRPVRAAFAALMVGIGSAATTGAAVGHHSVAMFDREHPIQLVGVVREFKFANPHAFIVLEVTAEDARPVIWNLEGDSSNSLKWDGWSSQTVKPGDELRLTIEPLRSGAPGGVWHARKTTYRDGTPIAVIREK
jgi:hypothetical protein